MFSTCLHCHRPLGTNEVVEHFPVGRRLAIDSSKGRLWVICKHCRRWNLTPLEERWEAIEECERLYRGTPLRASTENIGLARLSEGLELVRVGTPQAPEIAAWRYAGDFRRRWMQHGAPLAFLGAGGFQAVINSVLGITGTGPLSILVAIAVVSPLAFARRSAVRIALPSGKVERMGWFRQTAIRLSPHGKRWGVEIGDPKMPVLIKGQQSIPVLRTVMTARNVGGAPTRTIEDAIGYLAEARSPERFISRLARASQRTGVRTFPPDIALALEMALHEDIERRALEGELAMLRDEWQLAEEIAQIADNMLLSTAIQERFGLLAKDQAT